MVFMGPFVPRNVLTRVTERVLLVKLYRGLRLLGQNRVLQLLVDMSDSIIAPVRVARVVRLR